MSVPDLSKAKPTEFTTADEAAHVIARTIVEFEEVGLTTGAWLDLTFEGKKPKGLNTSTNNAVDSSPFSS